MAAGISLFPILTDNILNKVRFQASEFKFYFTENNKNNELSYEEIESSTSVHRLIDRDGVWSPNDFNLIITREYSLRTYQSLFGEYGVACANAVIGLAIRWASKDSKQRGVIEIGEIRNSNTDLFLDFNYEFSIGQLRGDIEFETVLYIKTIGAPSRQEKYLANIYGCILGELDKFTLRLDGTGSAFPVYEIFEPDQPLWHIKCDWEDPTYDQFSESISININKAHKNYKYLDSTKRCYDEQLLKEIMSNAVSIIITKLKEENNYWDATIVGKDLENGSVSQAINYFIKVLEWDISTPEILSYSIQNYFDKRM